MSDTPIRVVLVDDHASSREPLAVLLDAQADFMVVGQAATLAAARQLLATGVEIDVALVDLDLPDGNGVELIRDLRCSSPSALAIVLTGSVDPMERARALEAGAAHVLNKMVSAGEIIDAIRRVHGGETLLPGREAIALLRQLGEERERDRQTEVIFARLTPRDRQILGLLAEGMSDREIAAQLSLSEKTVRNNMTELIDKLGVSSRLQVLILALRHGIVTIR
jgi:DNA-binding NarL/FixJ family response regulator